MPKIVELRQDRSLIRSNFDGYKLSLDPIPLLRQNLLVAPFKADSNEEQYSRLHAELFSMQNLLFFDPWARFSAYFVNRLGEVVRCCYNENTGHQDALQIVYSMSDVSLPTIRVKGDYNYSLRFISEKYCVLCDGMQHLFLLDTGDRLKETNWKLVTLADIVADLSKQTAQERGFLLYDARLDIISEEKHISLALGRVQRVESSSGGCSHHIHLYWCKWVYQNSWMFNIIDVLESKGSLYYCAFEPRAQSLILSSQHEFLFRSQKSTALTNAEDKMKTPHFHDKSSEIWDFTWTQTDEEVILKLVKKEKSKKTDYNIKQTPEKLTVTFGEAIMFDHQLFEKVDQDLTTWEIETNHLQITLVKQTFSLYWPTLLADGKGPSETVDADNQNHLIVEQKPVANLEAPIEDCDFPMGEMDDEIKINRYHLPTKTVTHSVLLGSPPLFATNLRPGFPNSLVIRQDVDAGLWLQQYNPSRPEEWSLRHEGNLHAFGYVQASKTDKKFLDCSPDLNYALICEPHRHIFLYKGNYDGADGLRNRSGPQITIGKQHLLTLQDTGEVLGIATAPNVVTILTERCILHLKIE